MKLSKQVVLGIITLWLGGCAGSMERMSTWMGVEHRTLIEELGQPHRAYASKFGLVQSWYRNREDRVGCTDDFVVRNSVVISFASDCGIFGGWTAPVYEP